MSVLLDKDILITGCGRSGTKYISTVLRHIGLDIRHEKMGRDGLSSWLFAVKTDQIPWGPPTSHFSFNRVFHLVRHPLSAIPSIMTLRREAWEYIARHISISTSDNILLNSAKYWLHWNEIVEAKTDVLLRIEDMPHEITAITGNLTNRQSIKTIRIPRNLNTRRFGRVFHVFETRLLNHGIIINRMLTKLLFIQETRFETLQWEELEKVDYNLVTRIHDKAMQYGYQATT